MKRYLFLATFLVLILTGCQSNKETHKNENVIDKVISENVINENVKKNNEEFVYYADEQYDVPELDIVYESDKIHLSEYTNIEMPELQSYEVTIDDAKAYLDKTMREYAESIGEDPNTYVYDEEMIKSITMDQCSTYDELLEYLCETYNMNAESSRESDMKYGYFYAVVKNSEIDEDSADWKNFLSEYRKRYEDMAVSSGYETLEEYVAASSNTMEYFEQMIYESALVEYKSDLVIYAVLEKENHEITDEEVMAVVKNNSEVMGISQEEYLASYMSEDVIRRNLEISYVQNLIYESAKKHN